MMEEEDDIDLDISSEMADVEVLSSDGPTSTMLLAVSSESTTPVAVEDSKEQDVLSSSSTEQQDISDNQCGNQSNNLVMDEKNDTTEVDNITYAAEKSSELFGDSQDDDSFVKVNNVDKDSPTASQLFGGIESAKFAPGGMQINESFEILDVSRSTEKQVFLPEHTKERQGDLQDNAHNSRQGSEGGKSSSQSHLESSFETLSMTNQNPSNVVENVYSAFSDVSTAQGAAVNEDHRHGTYIPQYNPGQYDPASGITQFPASSNNQPSQIVSSSQTPAQNTPYWQQQATTTWQQQTTTAPYQQAPSSAAVYNNQAPQSNVNYQQQSSQQYFKPIQGTNNAYFSPQGTAAMLPDMHQHNEQIQNSVPLMTNNVTGSQAFPNLPYAESMVPVANAENSYMYTSPISSVMPQYNNMDSTTRGNQPNPTQQPSNPVGGLFVPDLYGHSTASSSQVDIFTPGAPVLQVGAPQIGAPQVGASPQVPQTTYNGNPSYQKSNYPSGYMQADFQPIPLPGQHAQFQGSQFQASYEDPGLLDWVKKNVNQDWSQGAKKLGQQIIEKTKYTIGWFGEVIDYGNRKLPLSATKNATETVLTTLDPGMEEYLNPLINLAIASLDNNVIQGIRQGFRNVFGHTAAKSHMTQHTLAKLPIGFEAGVRATKEHLDAMSTVNFQFNGPYVLVASEAFLTELQPGRWSCMFCTALRDLHRRIELHTFSQPISVPSNCVAIAYSKTHPDEVQQKLGYNLSIDDTVRSYKPYPADQDWCYTLTGMRLAAVLALAAQGLAADYRREMENPSMNPVETISVML